jgi:hypothetical protein
MNQYTEEIENLHRHIVRDYILKFHELYTKPVSSHTVNVDPYKLILDEYFTCVDDNIWLKLEHRPKTDKAVHKLLGNMMLELVLSTPKNDVYTRLRNDELCDKYNIDMRFGTHHFLIVKYSTKDITASTRSKITETLVRVKNKYPMAQITVGIIEGSYGSTYFDEVSGIMELRGDCFLNNIMPYKNPTYELNTVLDEELSYCHYREINSSLHMEAIERLSKNGIQNQQIVAPALQSGIERYSDYVQGQPKPDDYKLAKQSRDPKKKATKKPVKKQKPKRPPSNYDSDSSIQQSSDDEEFDLPIKYLPKAQQKKKHTPKSKNNSEMSESKPKKRGRKPKITNY